MRAPSAAGECVARGRVPSWQVDRTEGPELVLETDRLVRSGRGGCPRPPSSVRCGPNGIRACRRTGRIDAEGRPRRHGLRGGYSYPSTGVARTARGRAEGCGCPRRLLRSRGQRTRVAGAGAGLRAPAPVLGAGIRHRGFVGGPGLGDNGRGTSGSGPPSGTGTPHLVGCSPRSGSQRPSGQETPHGTNCVTMRQL